MVKKVLSIVVLTSLVLTTSCRKENSENQNAVSSEETTMPVDPNAKYATMDFDKTEHDFGDIMQGDKVETIFTFTNNGEADLIIESAKGSCGCTVPEYPKTPVKPGDKATMTVSFNSVGKKGHHKKSVSIQANTEAGVERLTIKANINLDPNKKVEPKAPKKETIKTSNK